jgi:hypothetical protein
VAIIDDPIPYDSCESVNSSVVFLGIIEYNGTCGTLNISANMPP